MSCRDKHVIAWKSFEIGDVILYTEDDVKKICSTPSSRGLVVHESIILPMLMKIPQKMKLSHLVNTMPGTFSYAQPRCTLYYKCYVFCKKNNRRLEFNDTVFFVSFVSIKRRCGIATREVDWWRPCIFLLNITLIYLQYIFIKNILFSI